MSFWVPLPRVLCEHWWLSTTQISLDFCSNLSPSLPELEAPRKWLMKCVKLPGSRPEHNHAPSSPTRLHLGVCCLHDRIGRPEQRVQDSVLNPGFSQSCIKNDFKNESYNIQCFWVFKEVTNDNGLKPQPGFVRGFTVVSIYRVQGGKKNQKRWCSISMVLGICSSSTVWLSQGGIPRPLSFPSCTGRCYWWSLLPLIPQPVLGSGNALSLTDVILFVWVDPQKEQLWTRNS